MRLLAACMTVVVLAGCALPHSSPASTGAEVRPPNVLRLENNSADLLRVYLEIGERQVLVGRVDPFQTVSLRVPPGVINGASGLGRLLVVPLGTAQPIGSTVLQGIRSDTYHAGDFLEFPWQFSGTRLFMNLSRR